MTDVSPLARKTWMATLAKASPARLAALFPDLPEHKVLRQPEIGAVMVRGRVGGTGAAFNLGEMTVTRASVQLATGEQAESTHDIAVMQGQHLRFDSYRQFVGRAWRSVSTARRVSPSLEYRQAPLYSMTESPGLLSRAAVPSAIASSRRPTSSSVIA